MGSYLLLFLSDEEVVDAAGLFSVLLVEGLPSPLEPVLLASDEELPDEEPLLFAPGSELLA